MRHEVRRGIDGPGSPEASAKAAVKIKKEFDGFSWHGEFKLAKTGAMPAMSGVFQIGYDPSSSSTFVSYDSMGSAMMGTAPSLAIGHLHEEGYMMGMKAKVGRPDQEGPKSSITRWRSTKARASSSWPRHL